MSLKTHSSYARLVEIALQSHEKGRDPLGIAEEDIALARLYSYAYRNHAIGAFHATRVALQKNALSQPLAEAHRERAMELLTDLANQSMDPVGNNFRALVSTFHRYNCNIHRVIEALERAARESKDDGIRKISARFREIMEEISAGNGLHVTQDTHAPEQASFIVPNLGITIVPLAYGDYHSWNLAWLNGARSDVPFHRHHQGVEIHLGYSPMKGSSVLGECFAETAEGYAMPIPPMVRHGYVNGSDMRHNVPFIFGSLLQGGWGVFLDVEAQPMELSQMRKVSVQSRDMGRMIYLEREIEACAKKIPSLIYPVIPASVTDRNGTGGLELSLARINERGLTLPSDVFRIISVVRGKGVVKMAGVERTLNLHDHLGIPAGITAALKQEGEEPFVLLDVVIKRANE